MSATTTQQPKLTTVQRLTKAENLLMDAAEIINQLKFEQQNIEKGTATTPTASQPTQAQKPTQPASTTGKKLTIEDVKKALPADLVDRLDIAYREAGKIIMVKPIAFLGSDNFAKVAQAIKNTLKGEYISAGKESRFEIKITQGGTTA